MSRKKLLGILVVLTLIISFSALVYRNVVLSKELKQHSDKLFSEIERENARIAELYSNFASMNGDVNEVRKKLYLPEKVYNLQEKKQVVSTTGEKENKDLPFFLAADRLRSFNLHLGNIKQLKEFTESKGFISVMRNYALTTSKEDDKGFNLKRKGAIYYSLEITQDNPLQVTLSSVKDKTGRTFSLNTNSASAVDTYLKNTISSIDSYYTHRKTAALSYASIFRNKDFLSFLTNFNLHTRITSSGINSNQTTDVLTEDGRKVVTFGFEPETVSFFVGKEKFTDYTLFFRRLMDTLQSADKRTTALIKIDTAKNRIKKIAQDAVFKEYLKNRGLKLSENERQDSDYYYFDFLNKQNKRQGSLGVQKHIGSIYLFDPEDVVIASLKSLQYSSAPSRQTAFIIPDTIGSFTARNPSEDSETLILIGSHEKNADTIILANLNKSKNRILLFSIPRDLYYKNRKINDYYRTYGGGKFSEIVSDITGLKIAGYIGIDMYAFIDVINILGGIDVDLKSDLTDPTYKVRDSGIWTTLHYSKGFHHFNGIEALRIARSRHTSSDFGRSDRQQLILQGVKDTLNSLNLTDMNKVYSIFKTIDEYLDTNLSPMEMISLFLTYRNAELEKKDGLSTFNVLYNTYSNIYALKDKSKQYDSGFYRGAWILLPKDNNWNVIKWYINKILKE